MWIMNSFEEPGSMIAWVLFCFVSPSLIISPIAGILVDRFSRKSIMIFSALYRALVLFVVLGLYIFLSKNAIAAFSIPLVAIVLSSLIGIGTAFFYPAKMAIVPNVVKSQLLKPANALISSSGSLALTFGAMVISVILLHIGARNLYLSACFMYIFAVFSLFMINLSADNTLQTGNKEFSVIADLKNTVSFLKQHKKALNMIFLSVVLSLISATFYNAMNAIATDTYNVNTV